MASKNKKVLILGAGLAGLSSAYYLKQKGFDVSVFEARDRAGGRVDTRILGPDENLHVEMGGEWIGKFHSRLLSFCKQSKLELIDHRLKSGLLLKRRYYGPGKWRLGERYREKLEKLVKELRSENENKLLELSDINLWHFLVRNHIPQKDLEIIDLIESSNYGEDIRFINSYDILSSHIEEKLMELADYYTLKKGNSSLIKALTKEIGSENILLDFKASRIEQEENLVRIISAAGVHRTGDFLVCALPTYSIGKLDWAPGLPPNQIDTIESLNYGRIIKIAFLFKERFWQRESFSLMSDTLPHFIYHATQNQTGTSGALIAYATGDRGLVLSQMSEKEQKRMLFDTLRFVFPKLETDVSEIISYDWSEDPYTKGAYALIGKGNYKDTKELLRKPFGKVFFAGEHTAEEFQGFMEGALESGERVTDEIQLKLRNEP